jgi:putative transposase
MAHMDHDVLDKIRGATNGNNVLGTERFQEEIDRMMGRRVVKGKACRPRQLSDVHIPTGKGIRGTNDGRPHRGNATGQFGSPIVARA